MKPLVADLQPIAGRKLCERLRKPFRRGHAGAAHQRRDNSDIPLQRRSNLHAHKIVGLFQATAALSIRGSEPLPANERDQNVARADRLCDGLDEVFTEIDGIDVHEDIGFAEMRAQAVVKSTYVGGAVFTAIGKEDGCHDSHQNDHYHLSPALT